MRLSQLQVILGVCLTLGVFGAALAVAGTCEPISPTSEAVMAYGFDHRPRLDFRLPYAGESCAFPAGEGETLSFELYAYNLHLGTNGAAFGLVSNVEILDFLPADGFSLQSLGPVTQAGGLWRRDVRLSAHGECGPLNVGTVLVANATAVFVDLEAMTGNPRPFLYNHAGQPVAALTPHHGAFAGDSDLYHCQPALCAEPLAPVRDLEAIQSGGSVIELGWTVGEGGWTMIRYRTDGQFPLSVHDGQLLVLRSGAPGEYQTALNTNLDMAHFWYTAFNVEMSGDVVLQGSQLECGSFIQASQDESVANETMSWGALKSNYR